MFYFSLRFSTLFLLVMVYPFLVLAGSGTSPACTELYEKKDKLIGAVQDAQVKQLLDSYITNGQISDLQEALNKAQGEDFHFLISEPRWLHHLKNLSPQVITKNLHKIKTADLLRDIPQTAYIPSEALEYQFPHFSDFSLIAGTFSFPYIRLVYPRDKANDIKNKLRQLMEKARDSQTPVPIHTLPPHELVLLDEQYLGSHLDTGTESHKSHYIDFSTMNDYTMRHLSDRKLHAILPKRWQKIRKVSLLLETLTRANDSQFKVFSDYYSVTNHDGGASFPTWFLEQNMYRIGFSSPFYKEAAARVKSQKTHASLHFSEMHQLAVQQYLKQYGLTLEAKKGLAPNALRYFSIFEKHIERSELDIWFRTIDLKFLEESISFLSGEMMGRFPQLKNISGSILGQFSVQKLLHYIEHFGLTNAQADELPDSVVNRIPVNMLRDLYLPDIQNLVSRLESKEHLNILVQSASEEERAQLSPEFIKSNIRHFFKETLSLFAKQNAPMGKKEKG